MSTRSLPAEMDRYVRVWRQHSTAWLIGYFVIGTAGVFLPALIASGLIASDIWTKAVALAAAVISGLQSLLKCDTRANRYHVAWTTLNTAKFRYEYEQDGELSEVISAYNRGEQMIETAFTPLEAVPATPKPPSPPESN
jgi:hypothetical protein